MYRKLREGFCKPFLPRAWALLPFSLAAPVYRCSAPRSSAAPVPSSSTCVPERRCSEKATGRCLQAQHYMLITGEQIEHPWGIAQLQKVQDGNWSRRRADRRDGRTLLCARGSAALPAPAPAVRARVPSPPGFQFTPDYLMPSRPYQVGSQEAARGFLSTESDLRRYIHSSKIRSSKPQCERKRSPQGKAFYLFIFTSLL